MPETAPPDRFSDAPEFDSLLNALTHLLFDINGDISTLQQFLETLESGIANNATIDKILNKSISNIDKTKEKMKELKNIMDGLLKVDKRDLNSQRLLLKDKILRDVNFSVSEFKACQHRLKKFNEHVNAENKAALMQEEEALVDLVALKGNNSVSGNPKRMQMIVERNDPSELEIEYQTSMIRQRDAEISQIQSGIQDVNNIFKDLSTMVLEQGQMTNTIESNIYSAESSIVLGSRELSRALERQKRKSRLCFYLFFVLLMFLVVGVVVTF